MQTQSFLRLSTIAVLKSLLIAALVTAPGCGPTDTNAATGGGGSAPVCQVPADTKPVIIQTKIGNPTWEIVDFHQFSAECGMNYDKTLETGTKILPAPNHQPHDMLGIGPGAPHAGPYDHEFRDGLAALNITDHTVFSASEATWPNCVYATWMLVPSAGAPMGSSPDSMNGPILPNTLFPIQWSFQGFVDGAKNPADPYMGPVPALDAMLTPPFSVDGHSHIPWFLFEDTNTLMTDCGKHEFKGTFIDAAGNGWEFTTTFYLDG